MTTLYTTVRFFCSVVAAFARLVRELRKAASSSSAVMSPLGLISPLRKKVLPAPVAKPSKLLAALAPPPLVVVAPAEEVVDQQQANESERKKKKMACSARRRPSRLVIPVGDDAGEVAAGWAAAAAAAKEADVEVEGEGFWVASRAGPRHAMEDAYSVINGKNGGASQLAFYGVFDGHGGRVAVDFVSQRLGENVISAVLAAEVNTHGEASSAEEEHGTVSAAIKAAYLATDSELLAQHQDASGGACATTAVVKGGDLYVAHVGDCRSVLSRDGGAAAALTADHTCASDVERERIERGGGFVSRSGSGVWRVQGSLAVSRSFGDAGLKRWVLAEPEVSRVPLTAGCEFVVIASDGLWDKVSNQEAVDVVSRGRRNAAVGTAADVARSCAELVELARRRGGRDDVTVMVVDLERFVR
ncbi:unnamed protein product [Urochloa humidicola]